MNDDCISREAVLDDLSELLSDWDNDYNVPLEKAIGRVNDLPSVNPKEPKTDVLDKISAELEELYGKYVIRHCVLYGPNPKYIPLAEVLQIIDKYKGRK